MTPDLAATEQPSLTPARFRAVSDLSPLVGSDVACSGWMRVEQAMIDRFADATQDWQWIHVDRERSRREAQVGDTIAHGFLIVSLLTPMFEQAVQFEEPTVGINYGFDRLRFTAPVTCDSRVRGRFGLKAIEPVTGGLQLTWTVAVERQGETKPALVADWLMRRYL